MKLAEELQQIASENKGRIDAEASIKLLQYVREQARYAASKGKYKYTFCLENHYWTYDQALLAGKALEADGFSFDFNEVKSPPIYFGEKDYTDMSIYWANPK